MKLKQREKFLVWYESEKEKYEKNGMAYDVKEELIKYCQMGKNIG